MQSKTCLALITLLCALSAVTFGAGQKPASKDLRAPEIANYKKWTLVNPQSFAMSARSAALCAAPSPPQPFKSSHPHTKSKFIRVFVNKKGRAAMFQEKNPRFPVGSVIIKEKLPAKDSTKPQLLTVMIKQRAGYDATKGDWEYLVTDGVGKKVYQRGQLPKCQGCHVTQPQTDYVFRPYVAGMTS